MKQRIAEKEFENKTGKKLQFKALLYLIRVCFGQITKRLGIWGHGTIIAKYYS